MDTGPVLLREERMTKKAWSGRFAGDENPLMERFNASISVDQRLYKQDVQGSLAHAEMLGRIGVLGAVDVKKICDGLKKVQAEIESGKFPFFTAQEDIHMAIEARLTELIGPAGGRLHTARSRNDQVALDVRLYVRDEINLVMKKLAELQAVFVTLAEKHVTTILPGYTHLQRAQPVLLAHHLLAYFEMLARDRERFADQLKRVSACPLGAGALAGSPIPIDREFIAKKLDFATPTHNSLDTVADRDFLIEFVAAASILMMHLSRLAEELILWSSQEFGFVRLPDDFCTGSSMMPQKVNPDAPELIRGKTGRVYGALIALLTLMKGLPLAYNKDMQEDKAPLFDAADTIKDCLDVLIAMLPGAQFDAERMLTATRSGFLLATDVADYLAQKGLPFREAHEVVGKLVRCATQDGCGLEDFDLKTLRGYSPLFADDVRTVLSMAHAVNARSSYGGTATRQVKKQIVRARKILGKIKS